MQGLLVQDLDRALGFARRELIGCASIAQDCLAYTFGVVVAQRNVVTISTDPYGKVSRQKAQQVGTCTNSSYQPADLQSSKRDLVNGPICSQR